MKDGIHPNKVVSIYSQLNPADILEKLHQKQIENPKDKGGIVEILPSGELGEKLVDFNN